MGRFVASDRRHCAGNIRPTGLALRTDLLTAFPYLGNPRP
jgi:hypothetical protein